MALKIAGDPLGLTEYNHNLQLGYNKIDALGDKEVRMKLSGGYFYLVTKDTTEKKILGIPDDVLGLINLSTLNLARALFGNLSRDNFNNTTEYPYFQYGKQSCSTSTSITFDVAFTTAPLIVATAHGNNTGLIADPWAVSTTGFTCSVIKHDGTNQTADVNWFASGRNTA